MVSGFVGMVRRVHAKVSNLRRWHTRGRAAALSLSPSRVGSKVSLYFQKRSEYKLVLPENRSQQERSDEGGPTPTTLPKRRAVRLSEAPPGSVENERYRARRLSVCWPTRCERGIPCAIVQTERHKRLVAASFHCDYLQ